MNWQEMIDQYDGMFGLRDMIFEQEGIAYFVVDFIGADAFKDGPLEDAARKIEDGVNEFRRFFGEYV